MNSSQSASTMDGRNDSQRPLNSPPPVEEELEKDMRWQLQTLLGTTISYLIFFLLIAGGFTVPFLFILSPIPLMIYDIVKATVSIIRMCKLNEIEGKDELKDTIENAFMFLYKGGIIIKMCMPNIDSTFLIAPIALAIIVRIVLSMGVYKEVNGFYPICRTSFRIFLLLMTFNMTFKIQNYFSLTWNQTLWPYWLIFAGLFFLSLSSIVIAFNACFCLRIGQQIDYLDIVASVWLAFLFIGFTISSFSLAFMFTIHIEESAQEIALASIIFVMYLGVLFLFTIFAYNGIIKFGVKIKSTQLSEQEIHWTIQQQQMRARNNGSIPYDLSKSFPQNLAPPSILVRIKNTLFKAISRTISSTTLDPSQTPKADVTIEKSNHGNSAIKNNESICMELMKATGSANNIQKDNALAATEGNKKDMPMEERGTRSAREVGMSIQKEEIQLETKGNLDDQGCIICFDSKADGVLMPCCHGGICFKCAKIISQRKSVCHFCRKAFWQILRIDLVQSNSTDFFRILDKHDITLSRLVKNNL